jgi:uridine kinase
MPVYEMRTHTRHPQALRVKSRRIMILDGILILDDPAIRQLMDIKLYVDADPDIRFIRRLKRDLTERGRTLDQVIRQYESSVRPMHLQFVEPSKRYADLVIPEGGYNVVAIDLLKTKIRSLLRESG